MWGLGNFFAGIAVSDQAAILAWRGAYLGGFFISTFFYHLVQSFFGIRRRKLLFLAYLHSFLLSGLMLFHPESLVAQTRQAFGIHYNVTTPAMSLAILAFLIIVCLSYKELLAVIFQSESKQKMQAKYFIFGFAFGFFGGATTLLPPFGLDVLYPAGNLGVGIYVLILTYAIFRYHILDIKVVIQKTILYAFWTLFISMTYAFVIFLIQNLITVSGLPERNHFFGAIPDNFYVWSGVLAFVMNTGIGLFVYLQDKKKPLNADFALLSTCIGCWAVGSWLVNIISDKETALWVLRLNYAFGVFVPVLFLKFVSKLTGTGRTIWIRSGYALSAGLALLLLTPLFIRGLRLIPDHNFYISDPGKIYYVFFAYFCLYFGLALTLILSKLRTAEPLEKRRLFYVFGAYFIGMMAGVEYFCSVFGIIKRPPADDYILVATFAILAYAIVKHKLLEIQVVIKRTLFYSLLAFFITSFYVLAVYLAHTFFIKEKIPLHQLINNVVLILLISLLLRPAEILLHRFLDKKFFKGTIQEISEQKARLETELERRERLRSVGILAAGMAHEIKNPLTVINTFADYLPTKYNDPEFREKFSRIVKQEVARVKEIVSDLLAFSKPADPNPKESDIRKIVMDILELLSSTILKKGIKVQVSLDSAKAFVDPDQTKQALLNIIMNALDAMQEGGGDLTIRATTETSFLKITIQDTGCGIPADKIGSIFDPFYTDKEQGTGLGLAVTHSIVEKNGGKISVQSKVGQGTTFTLAFPLA